MKKILSFLVFLLCCVSLAVASEDTEYYSDSYARLSYVNGDVFIQRAGDNGFEEGDVNLPMIKGDKIGTREGRAEIHFGKKNYLRIDRQTQLDLVELPELGSDVIQLHLLSGDIFLRINYLQREKDFEVHTPDASFYVLEEGLYRIVVRENVQTEVLVYEGSLEAAGQEESVLVDENESVFAFDGLFRSESSDYYTEYDDSFADWTRSRDELQSRYVAKRYLPEELYEYETELAYNGRWTYESPYGYVWIPSIRYTSWRPYSNGRWVWYPVIGWTWVSSHSWGWATSRYGRWHWRTSLGWYWIPTRRWGPSWVHWHNGYNYLAWSPLSYWNRPVVIVNNRFYGRNNDRYYPTHSRALTVIRKDQLQARSISKVALSQDRAGRIGNISLSSNQPNIKSVVDRTSTKYSTASKVLSRQNLRQVNKAYSSGKTISSASVSVSASSSRVKSSSVRAPSSSLKNSGVIKRSSSRIDSTGEVSSKSGISTRSIKRFSPDSQKSVAARSSSTQEKGVVPSRFKSSTESVKRTTPSRSSVTKRLPSSSTRRTESGNSTNTKTQSTVKRFSSSRPKTPARSSTAKKSSTTTGKKTATKKVVKKFPSTSSSSASSRGRAATAPSRSSSSSGSVVRRMSTASTVQRSPSQIPSRSSVSTRSTSPKRVSTPSRTSSSSSSSVRQPSRSSSPSRSTVSTPSRSSGSSRSTVSRAPKSSGSSRSTVSRASKNSSSARSSVSRSSSSKKVKKK
ncbi:DUF6600 domain-containing protein [Acidobacteriota bacterium]